MKRFTTALPYLAAVAAGYLVPAVAHALLTSPADSGKTLVFGSLLILNPVVVALAAALHTRRHGRHWWFPVAAAALFVPIALIPPLNSSAFVYAVLYLAVAAVGVTAGHVLRGRRRTTVQPTPSTVAS